MPRLTQPFVSDVHRPRHGAVGQLRPRGKRMPITSLWDEMASAAPMAVDEPLYPQHHGAWDGRPFVDDDEQDGAGVVFERVDAGTGGVHSSGEASDLHGLDSFRERPTGVEWPPAAPSRARAGLRVLLLGVAAVAAVFAWRAVQPGPAVAQAQVMSTPAPTVLPTADVLTPALASSTVGSAPTADLAVASTPASAVAPGSVPVAAITPPGEPDSGFDYRSARRYLDEQAGFLRKTCMQRSSAPLKRLRIHVKARPNGRAAIAVPGVGPRVADCVREALNFPFDRSPNGGAFLYSLGARSSRLERRPA